MAVVQLSRSVAEADAKLVAARHSSTLIRWTLTTVIPRWQHHKHCHGYYYKCNLFGRTDVCTMLLACWTTVWNQRFWI